MKKIAMLGLLSALVVAFLVMKVIRLQYPRPSIAKPYTVEFTNKAIEVATGRVSKSPYILAVRSDGSTVRANLSAGPERRILVRHVQLQSERKIRFIADPIRSVSSQSTRPSQSSIPSDPTCRTHPNELGNRQYVGNEQFLGFEVAKSMVSGALKSAEGTTISTIYYEAPDLGCLPVNTIVDIYQRGRVIVHAEDSASSIVIGEPDPTLFETPVDYAEVPATALFVAMQSQNLHRDSFEELLNQLRPDDRRHYESLLAKNVGK